VRRRSLFLLLLALPASGEGDEDRIAREIAEANARGDRGRFVLLVAEPASRVNYVRVMDILLHLDKVEAAEALARERQGPEAEGLQHIVQSFKEGLFPTSAEEQALAQARARIAEAPEAALVALDALRPREGTVFAADVSRSRAVALDRLGRKDDLRAELERLSTLATTIGDWRLVLSAEELRLANATNVGTALPAAEAFLDAARRLDDRTAIVRALRARAKVRTAAGTVLRSAGNPDAARLRWKDAREDYLAASDIAEKAGDVRVVGLCWRDIGLILQELEGQPVQALKAYERALPSLRKGGVTDEIDATLLQIAVALTERMRYDEALTRLGEILVSGRTPSLRPKALAQRAYVLGRAARLKSALAAYGEALDAATEPLDRVRLLVQTGDLHLARHDPHAARASYEQALAIAPDDTTALAGKARALGFEGDVEGARGAYRDALARLEGEADLPRRGLLLEFLAEDLLAFGRFDEGLRAAFEEVKIFADEKHRDIGNAGTAWKTLADLAMLKGEREKAEEHLAKAATIFFRLQDPSRAIELYAQETLLLLMLDQRNSANERVQVMTKMAETTPSNSLKSVAKSAEAVFEARGGRGAHALELLDEARKLAHAAGDRTREATALVNRGLLDPEAAADHVRRALALMDEERLSGPAVRPLFEGYCPDWGPGIALDGILRSGKDRPEDAFAFVERALDRLQLLAFGGRDAVLVAGLSEEQHGLYVAARADLVEARATGKGVADAEAAFDAMKERLRAEAPAIADLAWPPEPPLVGIQQALRQDEALVMALFDPYVKCALFVDRDHAVLRRVEKPDEVFADFEDLLKGKLTVLLACGGVVEAFPSTARFRVCHVPNAATFLRQRTAKRPRGEGLAALGEAPKPFGPPVERLPDRRLEMVYVGTELAPLRVLSSRFDADTVVVEGRGALPITAAALLAAGAGNVVVAERPPGPLDIFLDGCLDRKLPVAAAFHEASAKGALYFYGPPE